MVATQLALVPKTDSKIEIEDIGERIDSIWLDFLWMEVTTRCNLRCQHCYADASSVNKTENSMNFEDWCRVIEEATSLGCRRVQFIGGEPTLHPHLLALIQKARDERVEFVELFTNATALTKEFLDSLVRYEVSIACSFYSADRDIHDRITGRKGSFDRTVDGIKRILASNLQLRIGLVEMQENRGQAEEARRFLVSMGVGFVGDADHERKIGRGARGKEVAEPMKELCGSCWQGKLCVTAEGNTYPCVFARFHCLGNINSGLRAILGGEGLRSFRREMLSQLFFTRNFDKCRPECSPVCYPSHNW